jgi:branched-chain amino acid transport system substrate-binding protein
MVLVDAMKRAGSVDPKIYLKALATTDYSGITGRIRFKEDGDIRERAVMLMTYDAGQKVLLKQIK